MWWGVLFSARSGRQPLEGRPMPQSTERERPREPRAEELYPEFWVVETATSSWVVSDVMARHVEQALDRWTTRWVTFVDVSGSRVRVRTSAIAAVCQSTPEVRSLWRRFRQERDREDAFERE